MQPTSYGSTVLIQVHLQLLIQPFLNLLEDGAQLKSAISRRWGPMGGLRVKNPVFVAPFADEPTPVSMLKACGVDTSLRSTKSQWQTEGIQATIVPVAVASVLPVSYRVL